MREYIGVLGNKIAVPEIDSLHLEVVQGMPDVLTSDHWGSSNSVWAEEIG